MKIDRSQTKLHLLWATPAILATVVVTGWYCQQSRRYGDWLSGSSPAGLMCGIVAAAMICFEMLLWPRKSLRRMRLGPVRHWMSAHIWMGLACLPIAIVHSGFHWGGYLSTTLLVLLVVTVASGIYGLVLQNILPRWMLDHLPAETIYSQIEHVSQQNLDDAQQMLVTAFGPRGDGGDIPVTLEAELDAEKTVVIGAIRGRGRITGRETRTAAVQAHRDDAEPLWNAFSDLRPFLLRGRKSGSDMGDLSESTKYFDRLRQLCHQQSLPLVDALEQWCDQRRQFDSQASLHQWLHGWIPWHIACSVGLSGLLIVHIVVAVRYW